MIESDVVGDEDNFAKMPSTLDDEGKVTVSTRKFVVQWHNRRQRCHSNVLIVTRPQSLTGCRCREQHAELLEDMKRLSRNVGCLWLELGLHD
jgi:hypothetical protein